MRTQTADGFVVNAAGQRLCEACWQPIPPYVDFPFGLTAPDSDGDAGGNFAKRRRTAVEGKDAIEALRKAVCLPCYQQIFQRVYPGAELPALDGTTRPTIPAPEPTLEGRPGPDPLGSAA